MNFKVIFSQITVEQKQLYKTTKMFRVDINFNKLYSNFTL